MKEKTILSMLSYFPDDIEWESCRSLAEVETGYEDTDGYPGSETLGVATNKYGGFVLYRGSNKSQAIRCQSITISHEAKRWNLVEALRELADKLEEAE